MWEYSIVICDIKMYLFHNVSFFLVTDIYNCNRKISTKRNVKVELQEAQYSQFYFTILQFDAFSASLIKWWTIKKCLFISWFKRKRKLCIGFKSLECAWVEIRLQNANFLSSCYPSQQKSKHKECVMKYRTSYTFQVGCGMPCVKCACTQFYCLLVMLVEYILNVCHFKRKRLNATW